MMKVSILVPVYGVERTVEQCAESLFGQTYGLLEYIFVDDCSSDRSMELLGSVLKRYPERQAQVRMLRHDRNRGVGAARLTALQAATGDFVLQADSDDYLPLDAVERLVERQQQTGADVVDGGYCQVAGGHAVADVMPFHGSKDDYLKLLLAQNTLSHQVWARLIRRSLAVEPDVLPLEGVNQADDYCVVPRLMYSARRAWVDRVVYFYRMDEPGMFKDGISPRHVGSVLRANQTVAAFYEQRDAEGRFAYAAKVGLLKIYVQAVRAGVGARELESRLTAFSSSRLLRGARLMLRLPGGHRLVRLLYLVLKGLLRERILRCGK